MAAKKKQKKAKKVVKKVAAKKAKKVVKKKVIKAKKSLKKPIKKPAKKIAKKPAKKTKKKVIKKAKPVVKKAVKKAVKKVAKPKAKTPTLKAPVVAASISEQAAKVLPPAAALPDTPRVIPQIGDTAPAFNLPNQNGALVNLSGLIGKWIVFYFYPKDNTPGCTIEANDFTRLVDQFNAVGAVVLGVSRDTPECHAGFISSQGLKINLLSDINTDVIKAYGAWAKKQFMGREFMGIVRSTFLIDPNGRIAGVWPEVKVDGHADSVLAKLQELKNI